MYVVKRPFKSIGKTYTAGSVITEPAGIKRFKGKLAEGKIIDVTKQTYDNAAVYFRDKFGVTLPPIEPETDAVEDDKHIVSDGSEDDKHIVSDGSEDDKATTLDVKTVKVVVK